MVGETRGRFSSVQVHPSRYSEPLGHRSRSCFAGATRSEVCDSFHTVHDFSTCFPLLRFQPLLKWKARPGLKSNAAARSVKPPGLNTSMMFDGSSPHATGAISISLSLRSLFAPVTSAIGALGPTLDEAPPTVHGICPLPHCSTSSSHRLLLPVSRHHQRRARLQCVIARCRVRNLSSSQHKRSTPWTTCCHAVLLSTGSWFSVKHH